MSFPARTAGQDSRSFAESGKPKADHAPLAADRLNVVFPVSPSRVGLHSRVHPGAAAVAVEALVPVADIDTFRPMNGEKPRRFKLIV